MSNNFDEKKTEEEYEKLIGSVNKDMIQKVIDHIAEIMDKFKTIPVLGEYLQYIPTMAEVLVDYIKGNYTQIPWRTIAAITVALLYVLSPLDLIPDWIPVAGYIDDAFVMKICMDLIKDDLDAYKAWKNSK